MIFGLIPSQRQSLATIASLLFGSMFFGFSRINLAMALLATLPWQAGQGRSSGPEIAKCDYISALLSLRVVFLMSAV